jgi:hypothetical protein
MAVDQLIEDAHRAATDLEPGRLASELQELLGQKSVAFAVGDRHPRTIGRYARGERLPESRTLGRLVDIYTVVRILGEGMRGSSIKSWMMGSNPRLKGRATANRRAQGRRSR